MCAAEWNKDYPLHIEQREKERFGLIESFMTTAYNALRKHSPETMEERQ
jgi:hypothetical protein